MAVSPQVNLFWDGNSFSGSLPSQTYSTSSSSPSMASGSENSSAMFPQPLMSESPELQPGYGDLFDDCISWEDNGNPILSATELTDYEFKREPDSLNMADLELHAGSGNFPLMLAEEIAFQDTPVEEPLFQSQPQNNYSESTGATTQEGFFSLAPKAEYSPLANDAPEVISATSPEGLASTPPQLRKVKTESYLNNRRTSTSSTTAKPRRRSRGKCHDTDKHNTIEKRYRTKLNSKIRELQDVLPDGQRKSSDEEEEDGFGPASRFTKTTILTKAVEYILRLEQCVTIQTKENLQLRGRLRAFESLISARARLTPQTAPIR